MNKTTTNLNQNNIFLSKENKQTNIFAQNVQQFGPNCSAVSPNCSAVWPNLQQFGQIFSSFTKLLSSLVKLLSSLGQTAEQFGETADQTAEQFCLETLFFYWILFDFLLSFTVFSPVFCFQKIQTNEKETTEQFPSYAAFETEPP